jgi:hypothetical protein
MNQVRFAALAACLVAIVISNSAAAIAPAYKTTLLHPIGFDSSSGAGVSGASQVGYAVLGDIRHALLWNGTATSVVDLHPAGFDGTIALGVSGASQVGFGFSGENGAHALLWSGSAASVVDLHPPGFDKSFAEGVSGASQVGWGVTTEGAFHALLWSGSATSAVDLHPAGFNESYAYFLSGAGQVGHGSGLATGGSTHALLWDGSAASTVDLHPYLTGLDPGFTFSSAYGIDDNGMIVGRASRDGITGYAVLWTPIPEPSSLVLLTLAVPALVRLRKYPRI